VCDFRSKLHKLKYGTDLDLGDMTPPTLDKDAKGVQSILFACVFIIVDPYKITHMHGSALHCLGRHSHSIWSMVKLTHL